MQGDRRCKRCGKPLEHAEKDCARCNTESVGWPNRPETVLALTLLVLAGLFVMTGFAARLYHAKERALGQEWYERGEQELKLGQTEKAVVDLRIALVYSRDDYLYELRLAQALLVSSRLDQARAYLLRLWERRPEDATVNLELGRLAVRDQDIDQALRYFHNAIYGSWEDQHAAQHRRDARLELYRFLMSCGAKSQAEAELMALTAELPPDPQLHADVGDLFLRTGEYNQALKQFREALLLDPSQQAAVAGAGETELNLGNYRDAQRYLELAVRKAPQGSRLPQMLEITNLVLSIDPYEVGLSATERSARIVRVFKQALARLEECAGKAGESLKASRPGEAGRPQTPLQTLYERGDKVGPRIQERTLSRDPDLAASVLDWVTEVEKLTASRCGAATGLDEAILLISRKHGGAGR